MVTEVFSPRPFALIVREDFPTRILLGAWNNSRGVDYSVTRGDGGEYVFGETPSIDEVWHLMSHYMTLGYAVGLEDKGSGGVGINSDSNKKVDTVWRIKVKGAPLAFSLEERDIGDKREKIKFMIVDANDLGHMVLVGQGDAVVVDRAEVLADEAPSTHRKPVEAPPMEERPDGIPWFPLQVRP